MYNSKSKQFVFKDSRGKLWNFYYDRNLGLCYSIYSKNMSWLEPKLIQSEAHEQFYVEIDKNDCFHIVYQDKKGNIIYCLMQQNETAKAIPVLTSKTPSLYNKFLSLIVANDCVHIFFIIEHNNTYLLSHQTITDGIPVAPKKVDNISILSNPYSVLFDMNEDIYAFYHISDGKNNQIGYKKYSITSNTWTEYCQITTFSNNCENPKVLVDRNGIFHICYQRKAEKQYQLVYQQKIPDRNMWTSESVLAGSSLPYQDFSMISVKSDLIVYWVRDELINSCSSNNLGSAFTKAAPRGTPLSKQFVCVQYKSNSPYEHIYAVEIPASFVNGFKLMFFNQTLDPESGLSLDEMKAIISTDLNQLKKQVGELKENQRIMMDSIKSLTTAQQNIQQNFQKQLSKMMLAMQVNKKQFDYPPIRQTTKPPQAKPAVNRAPPISKPTNNAYSSTNVVEKIPGDLRSLFADRKKHKLRLNRKFRGRFKLKRRKR